MTSLALGLLIPLMGTMLGSAFVFLMKGEMPERLQKSLLGFASGVMVAASVWSLLIPAMEMEEAKGAWSVLPASIGFVLGMGFLLLIDEITPHLHLGTAQPEGPRSKLSRTAMLALAVTIHNLPEGMAVGVVFAGVVQGTAGISLASAVAISIGIAIQNIPEGAIISMPMRAEGNSCCRSFVIGSLSGVVEPIGGLAVVLLASLQQFIGINVVLYYAPEIFKTMGAATDTALLQQIIVGAVNLSFTILAILTVDKFGRRPLMIIGALVMALSMFILGTTFYTHNVGMGSLVCMLVYTAGFAMSWGPVCWVLLSEIFPNSIRSMVMSVAVASQWISNFLVSWTFPMLDKNETLTAMFNHGFSYWIYGLMGVLAAIFIWKMVPETTGKSLEEMEKYWKKRE